MKVLLFVAALTASITSAAELQEVASFPNQQITGVGVSLKSGRIFVNFPNWSDDHTISVAEIVNGAPKAFPNEEWNKPGDPASHFVCVQSVVVDTRAGKAFITESAKGAIIVVDLKTGKARRLLDGHPSTQPEREVKLVVDGKTLIDQQTKSPPQIAADGIALDAGGGYLYYHALTGHTLYRINTRDLTNEKLSERDLESKVENVGDTPAPDGMLEGKDGGVYLTDIEGGAVVHWDPLTKNIEPVIADQHLLWPDTLSWGPKGELYVTASQIENMPRFNNGVSAQTEPYQLWKITRL